MTENLSDAEKEARKAFDEELEKDYQEVLKQWREKMKKSDLKDITNKLKEMYRKFKN
jgi:GTP cyclohydrolase I